MDLSLNNQLTMEFMSSIISANMYTDCNLVGLVCTDTPVQEFQVDWGVGHSKKLAFAESMAFVTLRASEASLQPLQQGSRFQGF